MSDLVSSWPVVSLFEFCHPKQWPTIPQTAFVEEGYPVYGANGKIGHYTEFNHEKPTVLITCRGATCGTINVCEPKSYVTGNAMALDDLDESRVSAQYLVYALRSRSLAQAISGTAQPQITRQSLTAISIPLPPLAEQRWIAEVLDRAQALRVKRRVSVTEVHSLTQSIFLDLFGDPVSNPKGWPVVPLPSVIYFQEGPGIRNWQFRDDGIKLVNVGNIVEGTLVIESTKRYLDPVEVEKRYKHFLLDAGDFVVASSGVTWGKIAEVEERHLPLCLNTSMIRFRPMRDDVEKGFVRAFVESPSFRRQILRLITGSAQPNFGPAHLKQVRIPLPPAALQREFTRRVSAVEKLKTAQRESLAELDALFASLQHRAFRGEL